MWTQLVSLKCMPQLSCTHSIYDIKVIEDGWSLKEAESVPRMDNFSITPRYEMNVTSIPEFTNEVLHRCSL